ncbi:MAG TPA: hypothetical protein VGE39_25190 [Prosthecobacter sp.]
MSDFENIQKLIRLKRFETPGEGFTEEFLKEFHQRQRAEMLKQSSIDLLRERVQTWWTHLTVPKWSLATAMAAVCAGSYFLLGGTTTESAPQVTAAPVVVPDVPVVPEKAFVPKLDLSELPMANAGRNDAKLEESLIRKHLEVPAALEGTVQPQAIPASATGLNPPSIQNTKPPMAEDAKKQAR